MKIGRKNRKFRKNKTKCLENKLKKSKKQMKNFG